MFAILKWLFLALTGLLLAAFCVVNRHLLVVSFYPLPYEAELPTYLLILLMFLAGFSASWILSRLRLLSLSHRMHRAEKRSEALQEEITRLKHQPILTGAKKAANADRN